MYPSAMASGRAFLFDLDGTLTDSRAGLVHSLRASLQALSIAEPSERKLKQFLGTPLPEMFRTLKPGLQKQQIADGIEAFRQAYESSGINQNRLYDGVGDVLSGIAKAGAAAWVVTSKPEHYAERVVDILGIRPLLAGVVGAGLDETDTKGELIARALSAGHIAAEHAVMLGDRFYDIVGAVENGVLPVGALWGYGSREELHAAGCRAFARSPAEFGRKFVQASAQGGAAPKTMAGA